MKKTDKGGKITRRKCTAKAGRNICTLAWLEKEGDGKSSNSGYSSHWLESEEEFDGDTSVLDSKNVD